MKLHRPPAIARFVPIAAGLAGLHECKRKKQSSDRRAENMSLRRNLTFKDGVALVLGSIVGSGIFASPGIVFRHVESGGAALAVWTLSGFIAFSGALCYVEL